MNNGHLPLLLGFLLSLKACCLGREEEENVAIGKIAKQSSTYLVYGPEKAIDGHRNANLVLGFSCSHTNDEEQPWWRVDLLNIHNISSVAVTNRGECCSESLNGAEIRIGHSLADHGNSNPLCTQIPSIPAGETVTYRCPGILGRYVSISLNRKGALMLCEVEVYAHVVHEGDEELHGTTYVDECVQNPCGANTDCYNTVGSFYCVCMEGYISSTGLTWVSGTSVCQSSQEFLASLTPPEGQSSEMFFLNKIDKDLVDNPNLVLSNETVAAVLSTTVSITGTMEAKDGDAETANFVLKILEELVSTLVEPEPQENNTVSQKTVKTAAVDITSVSLSGNVSETPALISKGNMMTINLAAIAKNNNGSASAVLMSIDGMEKFMSPCFFESENITEMYSDIITATLPKTRHKELPEPVNFTMHHRKKFQAGLVTCVYWKENGNETHWSVEGCTASFSNETHTVCSCTHLSTFAILLQTGEQDNKDDDPLLEMVALICECVGMTFLALAILTFLLCTWKPKVNNTARLHLSISLFLGHLLALVGLSRTENAVVCAVIAGLLHFIFLSSFVWMLLDTVQLFLLVRSLTKVQVIQKEGLKTLYLLLIGYGAPTVVVGVSAAVFPGGYGRKDVCWLSEEKYFLHYSFIGPVAAILTFNLVSFGVILWSLWPTLANMKSNISQSRDTRLIIFKIVTQFILLGGAWILGFFKSSAWLTCLFIILNSQQGTFIFIIHCLLNKEVREEYKRWFSYLLRKKEPPGNKGSPDSISTVQK